MKKKLWIIVCCFLVFCWALDDSQYPSNYPKMKVEYNGQTFETKECNITWFETKFSGQTIGSNVSVSEDDIAKKMDFIEVYPEDQLKLKLEYDKDIHEINVDEVRGTGLNRKIIPVSNDNMCIRTPSEKGEHIYSVDVTWGETTPQSVHFVSYVIKLKVI